MNAVVVRNPTEDVAVEAPAKPDGGGYRFEMIFDRGRSRAYADTAVELLDVLIPGYNNLTDDERLTARIRYTSDLLAPVQAQVLAKADQTAIPAEDLAVLTKPRFEPVVVEEWSNEVPLVLLDVHYKPFSDIAAPVSTIEDVTDPVNIIWLRPADDFTLLVSLDRLGLIALAESNDYTV